MSELNAFDAMILPRSYRVSAAALVRDVPFSDEELSAMARHVSIAEELGRCRYFTEEERSTTVTMDQGVTTSWEQTLPEAGATREMITLLRQLFSDRERAGFAPMAELLTRHADSTSEPGQELLDVIARYGRVKQGVLDSWDVQPGGTENSRRGRRVRRGRGGVASARRWPCGRRPRTWPTAAATSSSARCCCYGT